MTCVTGMRKFMLCVVECLFLWLEFILLLYNICSSHIVFTLTVKFVVLMAVTVLLFWVVTVCRLVGGYQHFRELYCLHSDLQTN